MMTEQTSDQKELYAQFAELQVKTAQAGELLIKAFNTLDEWRHFPAYQLERRVDVFFGLLLPQIVEAEFGWSRNNLCVIPEFPLHKGLVLGSKSKSDKSDNRSVNVDYAVFFREAERKRVLLVELKTDNNSIKKEQLKNMKVAQAAGMEKLVEGLVECANHSDEPRKYAQLIWKLHEIGFIEIPIEEEFKKMCMENERPGLAKNFKALKMAMKNRGISTNWNIEDKVLLIYPGRKVKDRLTKIEKWLHAQQAWLRLIDFCRVREIERGGPLSQFLDLWARCEAGRVSPWKNVSRMNSPDGGK